MREECIYEKNLEKDIMMNAWFHIKHGGASIMSGIFGRKRERQRERERERESKCVNW